jgi:GT2 family glycosyltransferase
MTRVRVVIPTWNGVHLLGPALESLRRQTFRDFETVVVDSGSTDGTAELLGSEYPEVRLVRLAENRGFAAAVNAGIAAAASEIVVLMNNDTEADGDWLGSLVAALDANPEVGSCASRVLQYHARDTIDSAGDKLGLLADQIGHGRADGAWADEARYVLSACAAAAAYRRRLLQETGPFDERFSSYLEDVDLGVRAQLLGYKCLYVPGAVIYHVGSATAQRMKRLKLFLLLRNSLFLFFQYMPLRVILRWGAFMCAWPIGCAKASTRS